MRYARRPDRPAHVPLPPLALVALALGPLGCGGDASPEPGRAPAPEASATETPAATSGGVSRDRDRRGSSTPAAELLEPRAFESADLGALHGVVRFDGEPPERFPLGARKKSECLHFEDVEHMSDIAVVNDGKVQNAYVYIRSGHEDAEVPPPPSDDVVMDQRGCMYLPHVVALQVGQRLLVENSDPTNHNVNVRAPRNDVNRNQNMGPGQEPLVFDTFEREEHEILFKCDIHPWMEARAHVQDHPWFAITDAAGAFAIPDVPPGEYVVEAIHETFGKVRGRVTVEAGSSTGFALTLSD